MQDSDPKAAATAIGLGSESFDPLLASVLKSSLVAVTSDSISESDKSALPTIMELYLVHNRSTLTDTRFLGFPFHYWYTSQFLLILFVSLCWIFCYMTDASNIRHNLETDDSADSETFPAEAPPAEAPPAEIIPESKPIVEEESKPVAAPTESTPAEELPKVDEVPDEKKEE